MRYEIIELRDASYKSILHLAFEVCDSFIFHLHSQLFYEETASRFITDLKDSMRFSQTQYEWPGTISLAPAEVFYFRTTKEAEHLIVEACDSLFSWRSPALPDDLSFLKNGKPWLVCTAHEQYGYLETDNESEIQRIQALRCPSMRICAHEGRHSPSNSTT